jgi:hypothetical protein
MHRSRCRARPMPRIPSRSVSPASCLVHLPPLSVGNEFSVIDFEPKPLEDFDVEIAIKFCGVCASDVHTLTGGWNKDIILPMVRLRQYAVSRVT